MDLAQLGPASVQHRQANQIGVIVFVIGQSGQGVAADIELCTFQRVGLFLCGNTVDPDRKAVLDRAQQGQGKGMLAVFRKQRAVIGNRRGLSTEAFDAHIALNAIGAANASYTNPVVTHFAPMQTACSILPPRASHLSPNTPRS